MGDPNERLSLGTRSPTRPPHSSSSASPTPPTPLPPLPSSALPRPPSLPFFYPVQPPNPPGPWLSAPPPLCRPTFHPTCPAQPVTADTDVRLHPFGENGSQPPPLPPLSPSPPFHRIHFASVMDLGDPCELSTIGHPSFFSSSPPASPTATLVPSSPTQYLVWTPLAPSLSPEWSHRCASDGLDPMADEGGSGRTPLPPLPSFTVAYIDHGMGVFDQHSTTGYVPHSSSLSFAPPSPAVSYRAPPSSSSTVQQRPSVSPPPDACTFHSHTSTAEPREMGEEEKQAVTGAPASHLPCAPRASRPIIDFSRAMLGRAEDDHVPMSDENGDQRHPFSVYPAGREGKAMLSSDSPKAPSSSPSPPSSLAGHPPRAPWVADRQERFDGCPACATATSSHPSVKHEEAEEEQKQPVTATPLWRRHQPNGEARNGLAPTTPPPPPPPPRPVRPPATADPRTRVISISANFCAQGHLPKEGAPGVLVVRRRHLHTGRSRWHGSALKLFTRRGIDEESRAEATTFLSLPHIPAMADRSDLSVLAEWLARGVRAGIMHTLQPAPANADGSPSCYQCTDAFSRSCGNQCGSADCDCPVASSRERAELERLREGAGVHVVLLPTRQPEVEAMGESDGRRYAALQFCLDYEVQLVGTEAADWVVDEVMLLWSAAGSASESDKRRIKRWRL